MIICDGTFFSRELDKLSIFCIWNVSVLFELVACWMLRELASKEVEFDKTVTRTGTLSWTAQYLDMCAGSVFSLVFLSQSWSVFRSCDISAVTVLIRGSRELPCCLGVWQFCVCTAKQHVSDHLHALHYHLILTRGSGAALAAVKRVSGLLHLSGTNVGLR